MTNQSRKAFEKVAAASRFSVERHHPSDFGGRYISEDANRAHIFWQYSQARILALLDSEEMVDVIASVLYEENHWDDGDFVEWENLEKNDYIIKHYIVQAKAALQAIKQKIGE